MSYINSALRKVQKERDSRYAAYGDFISSCRQGGSSARSWRGLALPVAVAVILGILAAGAWLVYENATAKVKAAVSLPPPRVAAGKLPATGQFLPVAGQTPAVAAAIEKEPILPRAAKAYEAALAAQRGKRWQEAESLYQQTLSLDPRHVQALNNLGVLYMTQKRSEEAIELFIKAMTIQDKYVDPYYNLACLYSQLGNIRASLSYLERAANINGEVSKWAKQDNDFKKMKSLPEFKKITEELVK